MHKHHKVLASTAVLALTFFLSFSFVNQSMVSYADETSAPTTTTTKFPQEEPAPEDPTTKATDPTTAKTTASTTGGSVAPITQSTSKADDSTGTKPGASRILDIFTSSTSNPADKPSVSEKENPPASEPHSETAATGSTSGTNPGTSTTTKKSGGSNKTTTRKNSYYTTRYTPAAPVATVPKMTVPHVDNTEISGSTLSPMDAYFERISGDTSTEPFSIVAEETELANSEQSGRNLSTTAIVAICLVAIGVLVCALTLFFALRNKRANADGNRAVEYDDEYDDTAISDAEDNDIYNGDSYTGPTTRVDETSQFTVVSLDDKDYKD